MQAGTSDEQGLPGRKRKGSDKAFGLIKDGDEFPVCRTGLLDETRKTESKHVIPDAVVFAGGNGAAEPRHGDIVAGDVLPHEADRGAGREIVADPGQETEGFTGKAGQNQMADECASQHDSVRSILRRAGLAAHLCDGCGSFFKIIGGTGAKAA